MTVCGLLTRGPLTLAPLTVHVDVELDQVGVRIRVHGDTSLDHRWS
jgi:hypothetical protein